MKPIEIICSSPGMRRNGVTHPARKTYPADHWSEAQLAAFDADPAFTIISGEEVKPVKKPDLPTLGDLSIDDPKRMAALDQAIANLEAAGYGPEGQPDLKSLSKALEFTPEPDEILAGLKRHNDDGEPGEWGMTLRNSAIADALNKLGKGDRTKAGDPKIAALEKLIGFKTTKDEIQAATKE